MKFRLYTETAHLSEHSFWEDVRISIHDETGLLTIERHTGRRTIRALRMRLKREELRGDRRAIVFIASVSAARGGGDWFTRDDLE